MLSRLSLLALTSLTLASCTTPAPVTPTLVTPTQTSTAATLPPLPLVKQFPPTVGSGSHTITIYTDYQCPACINFHNTLEPILEEYARAGKTQIVYKQFPLTSIHQNAYRDALAALCAASENKYIEYKSAIYTLEGEKGGKDMSDEDRIGVATTLGLDSVAFTSCLREDRYKAQVDQDMKDGDTIGVSGTPTIILDDKKLDMSVFNSLDGFRAFMDRYLSK